MPILWLYAKNDPFYSLDHSRANFETFQRAGGKGIFLEFEVPGGSGHDLWRAEHVWAEHVDNYLSTIKKAPHMQ
jgi:hypothetical protein